METKREIRQKIRQKRQELKVELWKEKSAAVTAVVTAHPWFQEAKNIYTYAAYNREVRTQEIIETAFERGKNVWVPKVVGKAMHFCRIGNMDELNPGFYGIPEPADCPEMHYDDLPAENECGSLMIIPGVGFDVYCHRVGYGGGYYDHYLAKNPKIRKMALAFEFQIFPEIPYEEHDICPDIVVTEERILQKYSNSFQEEKYMQTGLPKDPALLLSVVNTKLRDYYTTLDALCEDMDIEKKELTSKLEDIGYEYDESRKQFI